MDADFARFDITSDDYECFTRYIKRKVAGLSNDPDVQADLSQEMWLKCFTVLDNPPDSMPSDRAPRNKYLMTAMVNKAFRFKSFDAPLAQNHRPQYDRMADHEEE